MKPKPPAFDPRKFVTLVEPIAELATAPAFDAAALGQLPRAPAPVPAKVDARAEATAVATGTADSDAAGLEGAAAPVKRPAFESIPPPGLSKAEKRKLAAIPLPNLPTLASGNAQRDPPAAEAATSAPAPAADDATATELARANDRSGLGEAQLARLREARQLIERGDTASALRRLQALNRELDAAFTTYSVGSGENLWQIAGKTDTYGNSFLWPLIWRANMARVDKPSRLLRGQKLKVPSYPSLDEVASALAYAHSHGADGSVRDEQAKGSADNGSAKPASP